MEDPSPLGLPLGLRPASPCPCPLLSLPSDILLILLAYLFPKDRCLLDSAILNHSYRPIFLQSLFDFYDSPSYTQSLLLIKQGCPSQIAWHRFRKLSIKRIRIWSSDETWSDHLRTFQSTLTHISLLSQHLIYSELDILRECPHLQVLEFCQCRLPASYTFTEHIRQFSQVPSIRIETYFNYSTDFQYVRTSTVVTGLSFPSIFCLYLTRLNVVDVELRSIFLACSSLQSLHLIDVAIEDETLLLLPTICPSLRTVHIRQCERVSFEAMLSILRHYTIPNLMNLDPPKLEVEIDSFREGLSLIIQTHSPDVVISRDLMKRLLSLLKPHCSSALIRSISSLFYLISMSYFGFFILEFSVLPLFFKLYTSIPELALLDSILRIVTSLLVQESHHAQIVSQRILAFLASVQQVPISCVDLSSFDLGAPTRKEI